MDPDFLEIHPEIYPGKRPAPFALDDGNNLLSEVDSGPRATKYPRILQDSNEEDAALSEHDMVWTPEVEGRLLPGSRTSETLSSSTPMTNNTDYDTLFPAQDSGGGLVRDKSNIVCFGMVRTTIPLLQQNTS